jgi:hypothetical protein
MSPVRRKSDKSKTLRTTTMSKDGRTVIVETKSAKGTTRVGIPVGSLDLPSPDSV